MYRVAVVGATGLVGGEMLRVLAQRKFPASEVVALASKKSRDKAVPYGAQELRAQVLDDYDFAQTDIAFFAAGGGIAKQHAPRAAAAGCVVIDNSSHFRMADDVPLIVPEVNADALADYKKRNIIANPNCSTAQLVVVLKPLHDAAPIKRVVVATYQSVSGAGRAAMEALQTQTRDSLDNKPTAPAPFQKPIAFNVIPQIADFRDNGESTEEWKMAGETRKILDADVALSATCVRVPVFIGHSEAVNVEFARPLSVPQARAALARAPGVTLMDERKDGGYASPLDAAGKDASFVSRLRVDPTCAHGLNLWVVADNLRKGAALNAVQIAEALAERHLRPQPAKAG